MAHRIEQLVHGRARYPWARWTNGDSWRAKQGKDFPCSLEGFKSALHAHARRKGFSVRTSLNPSDGVVDFQFRPRARRRKSLGNSPA
jgi:hypothetical protein